MKTILGLVATVIFVVTLNPSESISAPLIKAGQALETPD